MRKTVSRYLTSLLFLVCLNFTNADENKEPEKVKREVKKIMEMMVIHNFGLYQMAANDMYLSKDFKTASNEIIKYAAKMKLIKHSDKKFRKSNSEMLKELENFKTALESAKKEKIKNGWQVLSQKCTACHILYNIAK